LELDGALVALLSERFEPSEVVPRLVEVTGDELSELGVAGHVLSGLVVVHDASAMNDPGEDAAEHLVQELTRLISYEDNPPLFICCVNRGVLSRAVTAARHQQVDAAATLLSAIVGATSLVPTSEGEPVSCWPLDTSEMAVKGSVACWPMDADTLLGGLGARDESGSSVVEKLISEAIRREEWEQESACLDCDSREICPFRQNAKWLRIDSYRRALLEILRFSELTTRQRWNFRNVFTLIVDLVVGEWSDFDSAHHPCEWVHETRARATAGRDAEALLAAEALTFRLYPHALYPDREPSEPPSSVLREADGRPLSKAGMGILDGRSASGSYVRNLLREEVAPALDPASNSPHRQEEVLRRLEDSYSRSIDMGNAAWGDLSMAGAERRLLELLADAENEWDTFDRASAVASRAVGLLRGQAAAVAKRSVGTRLGKHGAGRYLDDYIQVLRDADSLDDLVDEVISLFGRKGQFRFDAVGTYGQARSAGDPFVTIQSQFPLEGIIPAPKASDAHPAHDLPFMRIAGQNLPVTFELYRALRLRRAGAPHGSLSASIQAVLDRIRYAYVGGICRDDKMFRQRRARYQIGESALLAPTRDGTIRLQKSRRQ